MRRVTSHCSEWSSPFFDVEARDATHLPSLGKRRGRGIHAAFCSIPFRAFHSEHSVLSITFRALHPRQAPSGRLPLEIGDCPALLPERSSATRPDGQNPMRVTRREITIADRHPVVRTVPSLAVIRSRMSFAFAQVRRRFPACAPVRLHVDSIRSDGNPTDRLTGCGKPHQVGPETGTVEYSRICVRP